MDSIIEKARTDFRTFVEYVLRDPNKRDHVKLAPFHHALIDALLEHRNLVLMHTPGVYAKSIARLMLPWEAGRDPKGYAASIVARTKAPLATNALRALRDEIDINPWMREVFPELAPGDVWTSEKATLWQREAATGGRMCTFSAVGMDAGWSASAAPLLDRVFVQDFDDAVVARSPHLCQTQADWIAHTTHAKLKDGGRAVFLGSVFRKNDTGALLATEHGWSLVSMPIRDPVTRASRWPDFWPQSRLDEYPEKLAGPHLDCIPPADEYEEPEPIEIGKPSVTAHLNEFEVTDRSGTTMFTMPNDGRVRFMFVRAKIGAQAFWAFREVVARAMEQAGYERGRIVVMLLEPTDTVEFVDYDVRAARGEPLIDPADLRARIMKRFAPHERVSPEDLIASIADGLAGAVNDAFEARSRVPTPVSAVEPLTFPPETERWLAEQLAKAEAGEGTNDES